MRRFCLMTTGRTGSTALMDAIARGADVAVPARQLVDCRDHELLHPRMAPGYARVLGELSGTSIRSHEALIDTFFALNGDRAFAGFKSMPNRHPDFERFTTREDLCVINLVRRDLVATAASFLLAMTQGTWRREGGVPAQRLRLDATGRAHVRDNLRYLRRALHLLARVPEAIRLDYEDLCSPAFASRELDDFFGRPIRLERPLGATRAEDYVEDVDAFEAFVLECWAAAEAR